jgi:arginase
MHAQLLGVPTALGLPRFVIEDGPAALRRVGLVQALQHVLEVNDLGDLVVDSPGVRDGIHQLLDRVISVAVRQARIFNRSYASDALPITLGGDHTTSLGTALALCKLGLPFEVVWLDAHGDFNTLVTSPSGNPHGMVLALLAGLTRYLPQTVPPWRLHLWGVRDLDCGERSLLEALGVDVRDVAATREQWPELLRTLGRDVLLSFDCDCCQPHVAPGTMTPVANGFERAEVLSIVQQIAATRRVLALDVVELHPDLDRQDRTAELARDVILAVARAQAGYRALCPEGNSPFPTSLRVGASRSGFARERKTATLIDVRESGDTRDLWSVWIDLGGEG